MPLGPNRREQIDGFLVDEIDSIPQLEALLLIRREQPRTWSPAELARFLYISSDLARDVLHHLAQHRLIAETELGSDCYVLQVESEDTEKLIADLAEMYRRELVRVTNLIHGRASRAVRDFASAFRFKKEEGK